MNIEQEIELIKQRNSRVEDDKRWETSSARKIIIALVTYILIGLYMTYLQIANPWLNAIVPTVGYLLSTLTLSWAKSLWLRLRKNRKLEE